MAGLRHAGLERSEPRRLIMPTSLPESARTMLIQVEVGLRPTPVVYAIRVLSGDHSGATERFLLTFRGTVCGWVPSAFATTSEKTPDAEEKYASFFPSGDHAGKLPSFTSSLWSELSSRAV